MLRIVLSLFCLALPVHLFAAWALDGVGTFRFEPVADGVWVMHGPVEEPNARNHGFMNNPAIIETKAGLVMIDPGSTLEVGRKVIEELQRVSDAPVVAVINTHIHGDHWLANQAVAERWPGVVIYAHPAMLAQAESDRSHAWLELLERATEGHSRGTRIVPPTRPLADGDELTIGSHHFRILASTPSHTDTDIMIHHVESGTVFLGDNAFRGRLGQFDASARIQGNIEALKRALDLKARVYVPGHGRSGSADEVASPYLDYLQRLMTAVREGFENDLEDYEIKARLLPEMSAWASWHGFDKFFGKHVNRAFLEVEAEEM